MKPGDVAIDPECGTVLFRIASTPFHAGTWIDKFHTVYADGWAEKDPDRLVWLIKDGEAVY